MSDSSASLWSPQIRADILSPKQILTRQAVALATQTKDVLTGVLTESRTEDETTVFTLNIVAPILKYRHQVLTASYNGSKLYPTQVDAEVLRRKGQSEIEVRVALGNVALGGGRKPLGRADDDEELIRIVGYVLKSSEVVS